MEDNKAPPDIGDTVKAIDVSGPDGAFLGTGPAYTVLKYDREQDIILINVDQFNYDVEDGAERKLWFPLNRFRIENRLKEEAEEIRRHDVEFIIEMSPECEAEDCQNCKATGDKVDDEYRLGWKCEAERRIGRGGSGLVGAVMFLCPCICHEAKGGQVCPSDSPEPKTENSNAGPAPTSRSTPRTGSTPTGSKNTGSEARARSAKLSRVRRQFRSARNR
jgi:hypothetical protein